MSPMTLEPNSERDFQSEASKLDFKAGFGTGAFIVNLFGAPGECGAPDSCGANPIPVCSQINNCDARSTVDERVLWVVCLWTDSWCGCADSANHIT